jgi:hypothetical protein
LDGVHVRVATQRVFERKGGWFSPAREAFSAVYDTRDMWVVRAHSVDRGGARSDGDRVTAGIYVSPTGEIFSGDPEREGDLESWDGNWADGDEVATEMALFLLMRTSS